MTQKVTSESCNKKVALWDYIFHSQRRNAIVRQKFLCNTLQIKKGRFATIQKKLLNGESLQDKRGKHENHPIPLTEEIKELINYHCNLIPNSESHYCREKTSLKYFDDPDLTLSKLYLLFSDFYSAVTGDEKCPIDESTYCQYFNHHINFSFSKPRTDVCNVCFMYERSNCQMSSDIEDHKRKVDDYKILKQNLLAEKNILCLEVDFGQNLPLPEIPVSDQFYKRLIWLNIFNVHVFGSHKRSYMYFFLEGKLKKGGNTVCNLILNAIEREFKLDCYNKIYLFSDSCPGQNKNYFVVSFFSLLSAKFQIEVQHVYPVRGHSYCSCDRNFGMYGKKKKSTEVVETDEEYIRLIQTSRDPPFITLRESEYEVKNFEPILQKDTNNLSKLQISKVVRLIYFPNGQINAYYDYNSEPVQHTVQLSITFDDLMRLSKPTKITGISEE